MQLPKVPPKQSCFLMQNAQNFFFLLTNKQTNKKDVIIINPNKDTQLAATFSKRFGGRIFTSRQPGLKPGKQPQAAAVVYELRSLPTQRNKGL